MNPRIICDTFDITLSRPIKLERDNALSRNIAESLGFNSLSDVMGRKYTYSLSYEGLAKDEYDEIVDLYNHHLDAGIPVTIIYAKWDTTVSGVDCNMELSKMLIKSTRDEYFVNFSITLSEINAR